ncbi:lysophospholipid acyltransferase family protein [Marinicella sp. S1101]|uniref:lysophospholipid acyltransferase family protein n=1 Tax=Marinicella marina TaxID=2996016 RepID=UPI002260D736|nr:lysophospholipid acyltransferase family protein [Marinicella marina]MCX7553512.1 lysophospholipid acyltransferase family protein [Marinicella marina]MDJ1140136.1 lysophospholipid acyltransferase family protein [Marinicella marina]
MKNLLTHIYQIYVWLVVYPVAWILTAVTAIIVSILSIAGAVKFAGRYVARLWGRLILWITPVWVSRKGQQHIVPEQSYVVVANHQSTYDILLVYGYLPLDFKWVMKIELRKMPFVGFACEKMGHIYVDRRNRQASIRAMQKAKAQLVDGNSVFFFPEGTRSVAGQLKPFKKGAFRMAKDLQLPILPVSISGADGVMASGGLRILPGKITMTFHQPISIEEINTKNTQEIIAQAEMAVASGIQ